MSKIEFHFKGGSADTHQLPVDFMINLLNNIRDLAYLIIAQDKGIEFNERFRPSKQILEDYEIKCELPEEGSYAQAVSIDYVGQELPLDERINPAEKIEKALRFVVDEDEPKIIHAFPNTKMRARALSYIRGALPRSDSDVYVEIANDNDAPVINSRVIQKNITSIIDRTQAQVEEYMTVVTGHLASIDFDEKKITITHPANHRALDCFYNEEIEDMLLDNRRQLVQITGKVVLDDNEQPKKITDVVSIQEVDLTPIELDDIKYNDRIKLHFKNRVVLTPVLDDTEQLYVINYSELGLDAFAYTRQEITDDIKDDIIYLWEEYAKAEDNELSNDAKELKNKLLDSIEEVENVQ